MFETAGRLHTELTPFKGIIGGAAGRNVHALEVSLSDPRDVIARAYKAEVPWIQLRKPVLSTPTAVLINGVKVLRDVSDLVKIFMHCFFRDFG